jgi:hypothetical protein
LGMFDLSAAFDRIDHTTLLDWLHNFGFNDNFQLVSLISLKSFPNGILGHQLLLVKRVCKHEVFFDASLSFRDHVCKSGFLALHNFALIRKYLTISTASYYCS